MRPCVDMLTPMRFNDLKVSREYRYALGVDTDTHRPYLSIPVSNRHADYEEYYLISDAEFALFSGDEAAASAFAASCGRQEHDGRLILGPATDRGVY